MLYIFFAVSLLGSGGILLVNHWFSSWGALWRFPLIALGIFVGELVLLVLVMFVSTRFVNPKKESERPSRYFRFLLTQFVQVALPLGRVRIHAEGLDKVPREGRFLLVSNHLCLMDPLIYYSLMPKAELAFISKKEVFNIIIVAEIMRKVLCLPIDRDNDREALKTILKAVQLLREDKASVAVFPEGGTSKSGQLQPFRNGVFKIAQKAEVSIVVCVVSNTKAILHNMFLRPTDVYLSVLEVLPAEELKGLRTADVGDRIHAVMEAGLDAQQQLKK